MSTTIRLFDFQEQAASQLSDAIEEWVQVCAEHGPPTLGRTPIPFVGHLKAVTGAGKTPILSTVVGDLKHGLVLWTSKSSAVVDQTARNLLGKYRHLLPRDTVVLRERPSKSEWEQLIESKRGLTIWVTTVGSWNEAEAAEAGGSADARLNMHRPQRDWGGDLSPWEQLRTKLQRPLYVVYDESHNQTPAQLDQLIGLNPVGFLMASATPPEGRFEQFADIVRRDELLASVAERGNVRVQTRDVVEAQLLKHTISVENFDSDAETLLTETVELHRQLVAKAEAERLDVNPKALYVVERSNPSAARGEVVARPEAIWQFLRDHGVPAEEIAVYTQTKVLPDDAVRVSSLAQLQPRHRHIICNRALQEGWDDPEAYIEYFDDESNSFVRISQVIGRALRQPGAAHFDDDDLNTATLFVRVANVQFESIVEGLKRELALYAVDDENGGTTPAIRLRTRKEPLDPIPVKANLADKLSLPEYQLGDASLDDELAEIGMISRRTYADIDLEAPGARTTRVISLRGDDDVIRYRELAASMRRPNGEYLRRRIVIGSRHCAHLIEPTTFTGPAFEQWACAGSNAQRQLAALADRVVRQFEATVDLVPNEIIGEETWHPRPHVPTNNKMEPFTNAIHPAYSRAAFNAEELEFAKTLDALDVGTWMRNPVRGEGYGIPLPMKVGGSSTFYPDFLWWTGNTCFALDPTGKHILDEKIRGKLLSIDLPKVALIIKGRLSADLVTHEKSNNVTVVRPRTGRAPAPEVYPDLATALKRIAGVA